eukprot:gb/GEZN01004609.1/.p1 GENE.gb/GEZN01004609.1/~~gb/GEZN01004609.1/.p1  ORF type:complete len:576 (+),score=55.45 gb/GEZN01004609.1/:25-1752(+)
MWSLLLFAAGAYACTNYLITRGASSNNSTMISYNADSEALSGCIYHTPAGTWPQGTTIDIYDWDSTEFLGTIPQAEVTYNVYGNTNENQVAITETTFGGIPQLQGQKGAIIDYGSLIYITLARATSARNAIQIMTDLVQRYGYASEGESFSIADTNEVWVLEMIGKGNYERGAVWVAQKIPDGYISGHANQARIRSFPLSDSSVCLYASDVIDFARKIGVYSGSDEAFSFSDVYNPVTFDGARFCEARVWSMFNKISSLGPQYLSYAQGYDLTNRMPLWIKPDRLISLLDIQSWMGDHYENTWLEMSSDVGAGAFGTPYRNRPLTWQDAGYTYLNERSAGTQQTGFTMVAQQRGYLPKPIGGLLWFAPDEGATAAYAPFYTSATKVPKGYQCQWAGSGPNADLMDFDMTRAFWIFNVVANFAYPRWEQIQPEIQKRQDMVSKRFAQQVLESDSVALSLLSGSNGKGTGPETISYLTQINQETAEGLISEWNSFFGYLFTKFKDGYVISPSTSGSYLPDIGTPGYSQPWRDRIVQDASEKYLVPSAATTAILQASGKEVEAEPLNRARQRSKSFKY